MISNNLLAAALSMALTVFMLQPVMGAPPVSKKGAMPPSLSALTIECSRLVSEKKRDDALKLIRTARDTRIKTSGNPVFNLAYLGPEAYCYGPEDKPAQPLRALCQQALAQMKSLPVSKIDALTAKEIREVFLGFSMFRFRLARCLTSEELLGFNLQLEGLSSYQQILKRIPSSQFTVIDDLPAETANGGRREKVVVELPPTWFTFAELNPALVEKLEKRLPRMLKQPLNSEFNILIDLLAVTGSDSPKETLQVIDMLRKSGKVETGKLESGSEKGMKFTRQFAHIGELDGLLVKLGDSEYFFLAVSGDRQLTYRFAAAASGLLNPAWNRYKTAFMNARFTGAQPK